MKRKQEEADVMDSGDEEDDDDLGDIMPDSEPPAAKKLKSKNMDREFSMKEITKLKKNETLFHSSLFRMQVSELLKSVSLKQKFSARIESAVQFLSKKIIKLPSEEKMDMNDRSWLKNKFQVPMIEFSRESKGVFQFVPPSEIRLMGSVSHGTCVKPRVVVDLALLIPKEFFQSKDYLNQRFMRKKALYLAALASRLSKYKKKIVDMNYSYHMGNPLRPVLIVTIMGKDSSTVNVNLHVIPESHPFKVSRFHLATNNIRPKWFFESKSGTAEPDGDSEDSNSLPPTKYYNNSILHDLCMLANEDFIKETLSGSDGLRQGIMLLKIWLHQRELSQGYGMFSNFIMTAYVAFLTKIKKLNKMMSSYQVFKTTLFCLSQADWKADPPSLCDEADIDKDLPSMEEHKSAFDCTLLDCTGSYNIAFMLSENVFNRVKTECQASLDLLQQSEQTVFDSLFMTAVPFARKFDHIFHVNILKKFKDSTYKKNQDLMNSEPDQGVSCRTLGVQRLLLAVLNKALGKRAIVIQAKPFLSPKWRTSCRAFEYDSCNYLTFGIALDPSQAYNVLDKGPVADDPEATEFRKFWGDRSEMRRFKDGSIHEAVLWSTSSHQSDRRFICKRIVLHILRLHCGVTPDHVIYRGNHLDSLLEIRPKIGSEIKSYGTGEEYSLAVLKAFEQVSRILRVASDLPLSVTSVQGVHPVFRHAEVFPPLPFGLHNNRNDRIENDLHVPCNKDHLPQHLPVLPVLCGLEGSGKWPDTKDAIECMKVLLHLKLGQELKQKFDMCVKIHPTYIDMYKDGFVFRLVLTCPKEITVLRTITNSGMLRFDDTPESIALQRDTVHLPLHSQLVHSVQQQHPVFSATVRLCKRWFSSQMVLHQIREEAIELMVASVFIHHHPFSSPPASPCVGVMRFLSLFSTFNWKNDILMVNLNSEFKEKDYSEIPQMFKNTRSPLSAMCIATPQDKKGTVWTSEKPEQFILDRLVILAAESLKKLERQMLSFNKEGCDFKQIFRPVLEHFDVTIKLQPNLNVANHQQVDANGRVFMHPVSKQPCTNKTPLPVVDFDVCLKFFNDLQEIYNDLAIFFYDCFGGNVLGMVWKPQAMENKEFKISNFIKCKPVDSDNKVTLSVVKDLILEDIQLLGSGIIETITS